MAQPPSRRPVRDSVRRAREWTRLAIVVFGWPAGIGWSEDVRSADAASYQAVCGSCHATSLVEGLRTTEEWREVMAQMVKVGARGTEKQFEAVDRVLLRTLTRININTAGVAEIAAVLNLGDATAQAIVKRRAKLGGFESLEQLKLSGVNAKTLTARKDRILFSGR